MRKLSQLVLVLSLFTASGVARAKVLELFIQPQTGGMFSLMSFDTLPWRESDRKLNTEDDYFKTHQGGNVGFSAGVEVLFLDLVLDVNQFYRNNRNSTLLSIMLGFDADFTTGEGSLWTPYLFAGVALGTIDDSWIKEKEDPQITHDDLDAQILFVRAGIRYEYKFTEMIRLAIDGGIGLHLLQISQLMANDDDSQAAGFHGYITGGVRFYWDVFGKKEHQQGGDTALTDEKSAAKATQSEPPATVKTPAVKPVPEASPKPTPPPPAEPTPPPPAEPTPPPPAEPTPPPPAEPTPPPPESGGSSDGTNPKNPQNERIR